MSDKTKIEWTDATWNPMTGCSKVSPACDHCYAERMAARFKRSFAPTVHPKKLCVPLHWKKPRKVFVCSTSDLFHTAFSNDQIAAVFGVMAACPQHTFLVLTKRPARMRAWFEWCKEKPLPNVWLGVTAENQETADERIPILLDVPAAKHFVSIEPMLGPVDLTGYFGGQYVGLPGDVIHDSYNFGLDWIIVGGETGAGARPIKAGWVQAISDLCQDASVPYFFKKIGDFYGKRSIVKHPDKGWKTVLYGPPEGPFDAYRDLLRREWP